MYHSFKGGFSIPHSYIVLLDTIPIGFMFWGLVSPVQDPRVGAPDIGHKSLTPQEKFHTVKIPPGYVLLCLGTGFWQEHISASSSILIWPFHPLLWRTSSSSF